MRNYNIDFSANNSRAVELRVSEKGTHSDAKKALPMLVRRPSWCLSEALRHARCGTLCLSNLMTVNAFMYTQQPAEFVNRSHGFEPHCFDQTFHCFNVMFPAFIASSSPLPRKAWQSKYDTEDSEIVFGRPRILLDAVTKGRLRQLRLLLDAGINVNSKDKTTGQTALMRAVFLESPKLRRISIKLLINYGAKVKIMDNIGRSALSWACILGREDVLRIFQDNPELDLAYGSVDLEGNTNLLLACMSGNAKIVTSIARCFRRNRLDVNRKNNSGDTALTLVKKLGYMDLVDILLDIAHVNTSHAARRGSLTSFQLDRSTPVPRIKPHTAPAKKSCNLPKLFNLYTEQLTRSYPRRNCESSLAELYKRKT